MENGGYDKVKSGSIPARTSNWKIVFEASAPYEIEVTYKLQVYRATTSSYTNIERMYDATIDSLWGGVSNAKSEVIRPYEQANSSAYAREKFLLNGVEWEYYNTYISNGNFSYSHTTSIPQ